jgi:hypothetical protein
MWNTGTDDVDRMTASAARNFRDLFTLLVTRAIIRERDEKEELHTIRNNSISISTSTSTSTNTNTNTNNTKPTP